MTVCRDLFNLCLLAALTFAQPLHAFAQAPVATARTMSFEVASIKPNKGDTGGWKMNFTANGLSAAGVSLQYIIHEAYGIYDGHRWSGGPAWLDTAKFDIEAKFDPSELKNATLEQRQAMLQQLLADRFKVVVHHESRDFPLYALVVAKNGPNFKYRSPKT